MSPHLDMSQDHLQAKKVFRLEDSGNEMLLSTFPA